ncbi:MAG: NAD-dependent epimerase/dehydratase family protein [Candidatus Marinimicrobia bacterium]|nr:NAD-dependent epimerase/dehydratase family protein [Candidatus Neomarinimicrobiota bacterium]
MKNVLITGGAGFIGSRLAIKLISKGYKVTILDNLSPQIHGDNPESTSPLYQSIKDVVDVVIGSVTDRSAWSKALRNQNIIVHLAAETGTGQSMYAIERYNSINIGGTALLLDILANDKTNIEKVIVASSRAIYGEGRYFIEGEGHVYPLARSENDMSRGDFEVKNPNGKSDIPLHLIGTTEDSIIHPTSVYGITKQVQEQLVMTVCPPLGIAPVAFRYQNVYGPGQSLSNPYTGILSIFSTQIRNGNSINIFEDGNESRDFVFIDDVVDATILGIENSSANGEVFNVGSGYPTSVYAVAERLINIFGSKVPLNITGQFRVGDIRHNYADITKIKNLLKFTPKWDFADGLKFFVEWVLNQEVMPDLLEQSLAEMRDNGLLK